MMVATIKSDQLIHAIDQEAYAQGRTRDTFCGKPVNIKNFANVMVVTCDICFTKAAKLELHSYTKSYGDGTPRGFCRCGKSKTDLVHIAD